MEKIVNIHRAKTTLSQLIAAAENGEEVIIARGGKPVAKIVPIRKTSRSAARRKVAGSLKGKIWIGPNFDDPLPVDILAVFHGGKF